MKQQERTRSADRTIMWDFILLLLSLTLWMISLFLVGEAAKSQRWVFSGTDGIPQPYSGVGMAQAISFIFIGLWLARVLLMTQQSILEPARLLSQLLLRPSVLTPGILMASFPPLIVGLVKLMTVLVVSRRRLGEEQEGRDRLWVTLLFLALHLLTAAVTVLIFVRSFL